MKEKDKLEKYWWTVPAFIVLFILSIGFLLGKIYGYHKGFEDRDKKVLEQVVYKEVSIVKEKEECKKKGGNFTVTLPDSREIDWSASHENNYWTGQSALKISCVIPPRTVWSVDVK